MRPTTRELTKYYIDQLDLSGRVLEIGGHKLANCAADLFPAPRFGYADLNITASDIPQTVIGNITDCRDVIADDSYDVVFTSDVFEHIDRPWLAASEIARILKPGGIAIVWTLWAWRNHPCPIDYWRYSPDCLEFLFSDLECVETGFDLSQRRWNTPGFWRSGQDSVPIDQLGGWRENWSVYCVATKGPAPRITPFKQTSLPRAQFLRRDTQGTVTSPKLLGSGELPDPIAIVDRLDRIQSEIEQLRSDEDISSLKDQVAQLTDTVAALANASSSAGASPTIAARLRAWVDRVRTS